MACLPISNIKTKRNKNRTNRQLASELRERRVGYTTNIVPLIVSAPDRVLGRDNLCTTIATRHKELSLTDRKTIIRKVLSGLVHIYEYYSNSAHI